MAKEILLDMRLGLDYKEKHVVIQEVWNVFVDEIDGKLHGCERRLGADECEQTGTTIRKTGISLPLLEKPDRMILSSVGGSQ